MKRRIFATLAGLAMLAGLTGGSAEASPPHFEGKRYSHEDILAPGDSLRVGQAIYSRDGRNVLVLQDDGNLVLYNLSEGERATWNSRTDGSSGQLLAMQADGNLVLYDRNWRAIWASNTNNHNGAYMKVQDDGNLVIYPFRSDGRSGALWDSHTNGNY